LLLISQEDGSRWSFNNLPYTNEYVIETSGLNYAKIGVAAVTDNYQDQKDLLVFVQSGVMIKYLYQFLFAKGLTLSTSATTDGQTIAGSISTGTHNAALVYGAMEEMVKGIHLVLPNQRTVFVQKESDAVVTDAYLMEIGASELINDDEVFNAAIVSCGTFGVIHGYLIQTEKLFTLEPQVRKSPFSQVKEALYTLDIASLGFDLDDPQELPWHF
jgi:FAD/FMN-containing dehydrogenase